MISHPSSSDAGTWSNLALFASLSAGAEIETAIRERRAGRNPSEQEGEVLASSLLHDHLELARELLVRLGIQQIAADTTETPDERQVRHIRRLPTMLLLVRLSRNLHGMHQRMLSLYPRIEEDLIEDTRLLEQASRALFLKFSDTFEDAVATLVDRGWHIISRLAKALKP